MKPLIRVFVLLLIFSCNLADAREIAWQSATTGGAIKGEVYLPKSETAAAALPIVIFQTNLSSTSNGAKTDDAIIQELLGDGNIVLVLDYAHHEKAKSPFLAADSLKLRQDLTAKRPTLLADDKIDPAQIYILVEGYRLKRAVEFVHDGDRTLAMDIAYPAKPDKPVPVLMEITCDNQDRMGSGSLIFCRDTLLDVAQAEGFAVAMVDHPVKAPYKGLDDPMPQSLERMKAAVAKLREIKSEINATEKIGAIGFSRGAPFAAMLAGQGEVNAALVHGNRFDYGSLIENDPMLARFEKAWGKKSDNLDNWLKHGAVYYLTPKCAPMFLNTSNAESAEYQAGLALLDGVLTKQNVEHVYTVDQDGRGHRVTMEPSRMSEIYGFFAKKLK
ncbi:MAG TPA: hypothetical protein VGJ15_11135 [Pirellulales bacterium]